jgi:hypothetical protein
MGVSPVDFLTRYSFRCPRGTNHRISSARRTCVCCSTGAVSGARSRVLLVAETRYFCSGSDRNVTIGARQLYFPGSAHPLFECGTISQRLAQDYDGAVSQGPNNPLDQNEIRTQHDSK